MWCDHCSDETPTERNPSNGYICCMECGKVLDQDCYVDNPTFEKTGDGGSRMVGQMLNSIEVLQSVSRQRTIQKGKDEILGIMMPLGMGGDSAELFHQANSFYVLALEKKFTRGRVTSHVAAACLYVGCRVMEKPYLLIDFSECLQTNVYVLGAVFLQLCKLLSIDDHPKLRRPVDPSLFIHRFTIRLLGKQNNDVSKTALLIIASMKRDWMQTGRKPSGLCGAALYISALSHGFNYTKSDIVTIVHICEATLTKRLIEFENTESGCLTIEEVDSRGDKFDEVSYSNQSSESRQLLCQHKNTEEPHFAHGLCKKCYDEFIKISGGLHGGAAPPAFQRAERQRLENANEENMGDSGREFEPSDEQHGSAHFIKISGGLHGGAAPPAFQRAERQRLENANEGNMGDSGREFEPSDEQHGSAHNVEEPGTPVKDTWDTIGCESLTSEGPQFLEEGPEFTGDQGVDSPDEAQIPNDTTYDEEENFSDIDDAEVDGYLHNEEEKQYKTIIWTAMNKEYLEELAAKEAAAAIAKENNDASAKPRKERKRRRADDAPPANAAEAAFDALGRKGHSAKINQEALGSIFEDNLTSDKEEKDNAFHSSVVKDNAYHSSVVEDDKFDKTYYGDDNYDLFYGSGDQNSANNGEYDYEF